jgi:DNA-binding beta-propeller fold protein YncE
MGDCNCRQGTSTPGGICVECDIPQLARNNYFTGKLLVERDFTDEQLYYLGKLRRHNQRLHGWGAVCGLKVDQHPNPACQNRYVLIEPGTAVDCCGREILVLNEEYFDFEQQFLTNWQVQNGPTSQPDTLEHTIQICISYRECTAENVPAVFDDCSYNGTACRPNRLVDGYTFDVLIDPATSSTDPQGVLVAWDTTISLANAVQVAINDATKRLYVLTSSASGAVLYAVDASNGSILNSQTFSQDTGLGVAVSPEGDFVYVALQPPTPASDPQPDPQIVVVDSGFTTTVSTLTVTGGAGQPVRLAVAPAPDARLLAVNPAVGAFIWATDITTSSTPTPPTAITVETTPSDIVVSDSYAYVANSGSGNVSAIALSNLAVTAVSVGSGSAVPSALAVANTSAGDTLAVLDAANDTLYFIGMRPDPSSATALGDPVTGFANPAVGLRISPGGQWVYIIEKDSTGKGWVQSVNEHQVELDQSPVLGAAIAAGVGPTGDVALSGDGSTLYIPYSGDGSTVPGGVAVVGVTQTDCSDIFSGAIDNCPDCTQGNCIVLATINGYVYGNAVTTSMIDNLTDRHLLVSTDLLTQAVRCLLAQGSSSSGVGPVGPVGPAGATGAQGEQGLQGIQGVQGIQGEQGIQGIQGEQGIQGNDGPGLETGLTRISALSWVHGKTDQPRVIPVGNVAPGALSLVMQFTESLDISQIDAIFVLQVWVPTTPVGAGALQIQWIQLNGEAVPVDITPADIDGSGQITKATKAPGTTANGVMFNVPKIAEDITKVKVRFLGDFVLDASKRAVCSEFVRAQLPTGEIPAGSDLGLEGGTFESWYSVKD